MESKVIENPTNNKVIPEISGPFDDHVVVDGVGEEQVVPDQSEAAGNVPGQPLMAFGQGGRQVRPKVVVLDLRIPPDRFHPWKFNVDERGCCVESS